jgi:hypothetical protein
LTFLVGEIIPVSTSNISRYTYVYSAVGTIPSSSLST